MNKLIKNKKILMAVLILSTFAFLGIGFLLMQLPDDTDSNTESQESYRDISLRVSTLVQQEKNSEARELANDYLSSVSSREERCQGYELLRTTYTGEDSEKPLEIFTNQIEPNCNVGHFTYADYAASYNSKDNTEKAIEYYKKALEVIPEDDPLGDEYREFYNEKIDEISE